MSRPSRNTAVRPESQGLAAFDDGGRTPDGRDKPGHDGIFDRWNAPYPAPTASFGGGPISAGWNSRAETRVQTREIINSLPMLAVPG